MKRNKLLLHGFFLMLVLVGMYADASAQDSLHYQLEKQIRGNWIDANVDNLGNYYLLSKDNQLKKINNRGDSVGVFNEVRRYGKLHAIDVNNPLKTLLYYRNFSTIVVLDRFMNTVNTIDLRKQKIFQVSAIAQSYDNQIWIFDEQNNQLKKIGEDGTVLMETLDFRLLFEEVPSPVKIIDQGGFVYLYDPEKGMYVFDIYGAFKTKLTYLGLADVNVIGKTMTGIDQDKLLFFTFGTLQENRYPLPSSGEKPVPKYILQKEVLYLLREDGLLKYVY
ncbi:MAG: hypothetical protein KGP35_05555 [Bacteroidetes bacterium]|nr:hypothetical protein [Bacteroidota bacterium]